MARTDQIKCIRPIRKELATHPSSAGAPVLFRRVAVLRFGTAGVVLAIIWPAGQAQGEALLDRCFVSVFSNPALLRQRDKGRTGTVSRREVQPLTSRAARSLGDPPHLAEERNHCSIALGALRRSCRCVALHGADGEEPRGPERARGQATWSHGHSKVGQRFRSACGMHRTPCEQHTAEMLVRAHRDACSTTRATS